MSGPLILALGLVALAQAPATSPPATTRAVVLPLRLPEQPGADLQAAAPGIERALVDALGRHASFKIMSRAEIAALVGATARDQLMGCDAEGCLAEIADALGAELVITSQMDRAGGLWNLRASVLDRVQARAVRRAAVGARSLDALLESVDPLARQLAGGSTVALEDPRLAERLGVSPDDAQALKDAARERPDADVNTLWTDLILARNSESEVVALLEGLGPGILGLAVAVAGVLSVPMGILTTQAVIANGPPYGDYVADPRNPDGTYNFPWFLAAVHWGLITTSALVLPVLLVPWVVLALVDALDLGRLAVQRTGCCRDEARLADVEAPGWGRRVAPVLAGVGAAFAFLAPVLGFLVAAPVATIQASSGAALPSGPTVPVSRESYVALYLLGNAVVPLISMVALVGPVVVGLVASVVLIATEKAALTDE